MTFSIKSSSSESRRGCIDVSRADGIRIRGSVYGTFEVAQDADHICAVRRCFGIRAVPAYEKPPARPVDNCFL